MNSKTKRITVIGMLCAITYVTMVVGRIPIILFLKYDPSDVIVTLGGFIWGPMTSCIVSVIVATLETVSYTHLQVLWFYFFGIMQSLRFLPRILAVPLPHLYLREVLDLFLPRPVLWMLLSSHRQVLPPQFPSLRFPLR